VSGPEAVGAWIVAASLGTTLVILAKAIAKRIGGGSEKSHDVDALRDEVEALRSELDAVHGRLQQVDELAGRVDFAERMLAQVRDKSALPPGGRS
jgi:hypothetical protein